MQKAVFFIPVFTVWRIKMAMYKVEICGVNTAKLPLLTDEEKKELFEKIQKVTRTQGSSLLRVI